MAHNESISSSDNIESEHDTGIRNQVQDQDSSHRGPSLGITSRTSGVISFSHNVSVRLNEKNFLLWKQQIVSAIYGYGLEKHLTEEHIPPKFKNVQEETAAILNPEFSNWRRQDQLLMSWILASMTEGMLTRVVGCNFTYEVWEKVRIHFTSQTRAKVKQFKTELKSVKKGSLRMYEYMLKVKGIVDSLAVVGNPVPINDYIEDIFDGLPEEYESVITTVLS